MQKIWRKSFRLQNDVRKLAMVGVWLNEQALVKTLNFI